MMVTLTDADCLHAYLMKAVLIELAVLEYSVHR